MFQALVVIGIAAVILLLIALSTYNSLTQLRHEVRLAWAGLDEQLKRRYELVSTLIARVQSIGGEPAGKLPAVTTAKNQAAVAFNPTQLAVAETALTQAIQAVLASGASDPAWTADAELGKIQQQLLICQKKIAQSCNRYNRRVAALNESLNAFPAVFTARLIGLKEQPVFELPADL